MAKTTIPGTQPIPTAANSSTQFAYFGVNTAFTDPQTGYLTTYGQRFLNQQILPALKNATAVTSFAFQSQYGIEGKVTNINGAVSLALSLENITPASINCSGTVIAEEFIGSGAGLTDIPFSAIVGSAAEEAANQLPFTGIWYDVVGLAYETTLSYNLTSRTLAITASALNNQFRFWVQGTPYTVTGYASVTHSATQGLWYIYYDNTGTLQASQTTWNILDVAPVALVYYDATTPDAFFFDERHHYDTPVEWHQSQHFAIGTFIKYPATDFVLSSYVIGEGDNAGVQWALSSGTAVDEDIEILTTAIPAAGPYYVINKTGSAGNFVRTSQIRPYISNGLATDVLEYNQYTGSTWQMTAVPNTDYVNYWLFGTTGYDQTDQILIIPGQAVHATLATAQAETVSSVNLTGFPTLEFCPLYQITFHVDTGSFSNHGSCAIAAVTKIFSSRSTLSLNAPTFTNPMSAVGDMIWGDVAGAPSRLAGYTGSNLAVLTQIGTGGSSQEPVWMVPANGLTGPTGATGGTGNTGTAGSFTIGNKTLLGNNTGSTGVPYGIGLATGLQFFGLAALGVNLANPGPIGGATASTGAFTSINLTVYAVASLPSGVQGMKAMVNNALTPSFGVAVVGGGTVVTPVFYNGSAWIVG